MDAHDVLIRELGIYSIEVLKELLYAMDERIARERRKSEPDYPWIQACNQVRRAMIDVLEIKGEVRMIDAYFESRAVNR
jgi:hypothetical protein